MSDNRIKLDNALHRAMLNRAILKRKLGLTRQELQPDALAERGRKNIKFAIDDATNVAQDQLQRYRWPIAIAAIAGIGYALRGPIQALAPKVWEQLQSLGSTHGEEASVPAADTMDISPPPATEQNDEAV